jgi:hypothetical protein
MLSGLLVLLAAASTPTVTLAAPGLKTVGLPPELADFYTEHLAQQVALAGGRAVTQREISSLLGLERQKQLLGCSDASSSCMAELAGALGADGVVIGDIGKVGSAVQINLRVVSATGKLLGVFSRTAGGEEKVLGALEDAAKSLLEQTEVALGRARPKASGSPLVWWIPGAVGLIAVGVGTGFLVDARGQAEKLRTATLNEAETLDTRQHGATSQTVGWVLVPIGVAAVAASAALFFLLDDEPAVQPAVSFGRDGAALSFQVRF